MTIKNDDTPEPDATPPRGKSDYLHMRISPELKQRIRDEAHRRHIDVSALVSIVMGDWLSRNSKALIDLSAMQPDDIK